MKITIIGSGNVGTALGLRFFERNVSVLEVFSRNEIKSKQLAENIGSQSIKNLNQINPNSDLYIIAVKDDAISEVAKELSKSISKDAIVTHTSGSISSDVLKPFFQYYGVFYPLQTFTKGKKVDFEKLPMCIYGNITSVEVALERLAFKICPNVSIINDEARAVLHVAAVFVNNFTNFMFTIGKDILDKERLDFSILKPLIMETVLKVENNEPKDMQTGPALRKDVITMQRHLQQLESFPDYQTIYRLLSKGIVEMSSRETTKG